jgi:hypothetical protein
MTPQDRAWHEHYEQALPFGDKRLVADCFCAVHNVLLNAGEPTAKDDRAEALVAAIARFIVESRQQRTL